MVLLVGPSCYIVGLRVGNLTRSYGGPYSKYVGKCYHPKSALQPFDSGFLRAGLASPRVSGSVHSLAKSHCYGFRRRESSQRSSLRSHATRTAAVVIIFETKMLSTDVQLVKWRSYSSGYPTTQLPKPK
jgi:hypothetical protein